MSATKTCAYCGRNKSLTKEHLLPAALYARTPELDSQFLRAAEGQLVGGELTVRDVCADCNNGPLSKLDASFLRLYDRFFANVVATGQSVRFEYDFDLLARWLLKAAYNSARAHRSDVERLKPFAPYILQSSPDPPRLAVFLQLVVPHALKPDDQQLDPDLKRMTEIPPVSMRIGIADNPFYQERFSVSRLIGIRSYQFYVLAPLSEDTPRHSWRRSLREFHRKVQGAVLLDPRHRVEVVSASRITAVDIRERHLMDHLELYERDRQSRGSRPLVDLLNEWETDKT